MDGFNMRKTFICILFTLAALAGKSQQMPDSIQTKYDAAKTFHDKGQIITNYVFQLRVPHRSSLEFYCRNSLILLIKKTMQVLDIQNYLSVFPSLE